MFNYNMIIFWETILLEKMMAQLSALQILVEIGYVVKPESCTRRSSRENVVDHAARIFNPGAATSIRLRNREIITKYAGAIHDLFIRITQKLAQGLGVKSEQNFENWIYQFRINKYHFTPQSVGSSGVQTHTDSGFLTILQDDEGVGGLKVMDGSGQFIPVDPWPGTLIVNVGDMAKLWSNGRLCNVRHRVLCKEAKVRISIASFMLGPKGAIEAPAELVDEEHPRLYIPITYEENRKLRVTKDMHAGEAIELHKNVVI